LARVSSRRHPPLVRAARLARAADRHPLLDHFGRARAGGVVDPQAAVMIPVTAFAGKKVAIFGLGGSGLASASALLAGGADVVGWDDSADAVTKATSAGIPSGDLRQLDWSKISALVLAPGVPLTHPAPHWTVALARAAGVEVVGDIELFCRERRGRAPRATLRAVTRTTRQ